MPIITDGIFHADRPSNLANTDDISLPGQQRDDNSELLFNGVVISANILTAGYKCGKPGVHANICHEGTHGDDAGMQGRHTLGRSAILAQAFVDERVLFGFLQETRTPEGQYRVSPFHVVSSGKDAQGLDGSESWVNLDVPYGKIGGRDVYLDRKQIQVCHCEPSILLCTCIAPQLSVLLGSARAIPKTTDHTQQERDAWWKRLTDAIAKCKKDFLVIIGLDVNGKLGSVVSDHVQEHGKEKQCVNGTALHKLVADLNLFVPSTFAHLHQGTTQTFFNPRYQSWKRKDYILVCDKVLALTQRSYVASHIDTTIKRVDHLVVALTMVGSIQPNNSRQWRQQLGRCASPATVCSCTQQRSPTNMGS